MDSLYPPLYSETSLSGRHSPSGERTRLLNNAEKVAVWRPDHGSYQKFTDSNGMEGNSKAQTPVILATQNEWKTMSESLSSEKKRNPWCGSILAFLSGTFFTLSSAAVKALHTVDPMELLVIRTSLQVLCMLPIALYNKANLFGPKGHRITLQVQGSVGGFTLVLLFFTFRRLPLGDATTIIFSSPVFVMVMSFIILREPCGFFRTLIVVTLLTGVVLIAKPPFIFELFIENKRQYDVIGYTSALLATLFTALNIVVMRKCKEVHYSVVVLQLSLWGLFSAGCLLALFAFYGHEEVVPPRGTDQWILTILVSVLGLSGQVLVAQALGLEGAGKVAVIRSLDIILAFILQVTVFGEMPDWMSGAGATLVLACVVGMAFEEQIHKLVSLLP